MNCISQRLFIATLFIFTVATSSNSIAQSKIDIDFNELHKGWYVGFDVSYDDITYDFTGLGLGVGASHSTNASGIIGYSLTESDFLLGFEIRLQNVIIEDNSPRFVVTGTTASGERTTIELLVGYESINQRYLRMGYIDGYTIWYAAFGKDSESRTLTTIGLEAVVGEQKSRIRFEITQSVTENNAYEALSFGIGYIWKF